MTARDKVLEALACDGGPRSLVRVVGALSAFDLAKRTGYSLSTVRKALRKLERDNLVFACFPFGRDRGDGRNGNTGLWLRNRPGAHRW